VISAFSKMTFEQQLFGGGGGMHNFKMFRNKLRKTTQISQNQEF